jgi:class 3 adenylate cyclase
MATLAPAESLDRVPTPLLIAFADLTRYALQSRCVEDQLLADTMDRFYERVGARGAGAGGRVVKFIGDASLMVFPADAVDRGVEALLELKQEVDDWFEAMGWPCRMIVKVHFGTAIAGGFGASGAKRFDVIGSAVNAAAMLDSTGVALSAEAFRKLGPELRQRFKKHTPTITYIRAGDPHRFRRK